MANSDLEERFMEILIDECKRNKIKLPPPARELKFNPQRKWRWDFAWPTEKVAVEIDGGSWNGGRHASGVGMQADRDKANWAVSHGWKVLRFTNVHLREPDKVFELVLTVLGALDQED